MLIAEEPRLHVEKVPLDADSDQRRLEKKEPDSPPILSLVQAPYLPPILEIASPLTDEAEPSSPIGNKIILGLQWDKRKSDENGNW